MKNINLFRRIFAITYDRMLLEIGCELKSIEAYY